MELNPLQVKGMLGPLVTQRIKDVCSYITKTKENKRHKINIHSYLGMVDPRPEVSVDIVLRAFKLAGYSYYVVLSKSRDQEHVKVRYALIYHLLYTVKPKLSLKRVGQLVGGRDHTSIIHAKSAIQNAKDIGDTRYDGHIDKIFNAIERILAIRQSQMLNNVSKEGDDYAL